MHWFSLPVPATDGLKKKGPFPFRLRFLHQVVVAWAICASSGGNDPVWLFRVPSSKPSASSFSSDTSLFTSSLHRNLLLLLGNRWLGSEGKKIDRTLLLLRATGAAASSSPLLFSKASCCRFPKRTLVFLSPCVLGCYRFLLRHITHPTLPNRFYLVDQGLLLLRKK